jgi:hypothetical protein
MRPIILVMLLVDLGIVLATAYGVAVRRPTADRLRPIWSSFVISLLVGGSTSVNIAGDHVGSPGADVLAFVGPLMVGMAIMAAIVAFRERRAAAAPVAP